MASTWGNSWATSWGTTWDLTFVSVPDVTGLSQEDAIAALEAAGFSVSIVTAASSTVPEGTVISQSPAGGSESTAGAIVTITVSSGEVDLTDPKFQGPSHNTRIRWQKKVRPQGAKEIEPPPAPTAAAAPPAPKAPPRSTGMGEVTPPPVAPVAVPEIKVPNLKVVAPPKAAEPAPVEAPAPVEPPASPPTISDTDLQRVAASVIEQVAAVFEGAMSGLTREVVQLQKQMQAQAKAHAQEMTRITEMLRAAEKREINRARAEALARKIAEGDE